jgi:hypothetical protein
VRNLYKILLGTPAWKRQLGRYTCRMEDNIKVDLKEIECEDVD